MNTMTEAQAHPLTDVIPPLTARDRCDHADCPSQAYVAVLMKVDSGHPLLFCGHHAKKVMPVILAQHPFAVRDDISVLAGA